MSKNFKPLAFDKCNVGKRIKSTKKKFLWRFELDNKEYEVILFLSKLSGKRKILLNGDIHTTAKRSSTVFGSYPLRIGSHSLLVFEVDDNKFDLRINNMSFEATFNSQKMNSGYNYSTSNEPKFPSNYDDPFKTSINRESPDSPKRSIRKASPEYNIRNYSPEQPKRVAPSRTVYKKPEPEYSPPPKKVEIKKEKAPEPTPLDLFDMPVHSVSTNLPEDLFSVPLSSSHVEERQSYNPFEESKPKPQPVFEPVVEQSRNMDFGLFDLDLNKPSPAEAKKYQEMNKPVSIGGDVPNVPMHVLKSQNPAAGNNMNTGVPGMMPGMMNPMMNPMMMNPMMMYNPFMTGMMPNPWMQNPK